MFESMDGEYGDLDADATLGAARAVLVRSRRADAQQLLVAAHWADLHGVLADQGGPVLPGTERLVTLGGPGTPEVAEFCVAELGAELEIGDHAAATLIGQALELRHRLPQLWGRVMCGEVKAWVARKVAAVTRQHPSHVAAHVDATVTEYASSLGWTRLSALVDAEAVRADPVAAEARAKQVQDQLGVWVSPSEEGTKAVFAKADAPDVIFFDATIDRIADRLQALGDDSGHQTRRARALGLIARPGATLDLFETRTSDADVPDRGVDDPPVPVEAPNRRDPRGRRREPKRAVLYVHLSLDALATGQGVARLEDVGPITLGQVRDFLSGCQVTVTPVVDLANQAPVDGYEVPDRLREAVHLLAPADCFPYASATGRGLDVDHTERFRHRPGPDPNGRPPPGQTGPGNLGKLTRRHHRLKTHAGGWHVRQPYPGIWIWRTPHHRYYLVDHTGTRRLGTHRPNSAR